MFDSTDPPQGTVDGGHPERSAVPFHGFLGLLRAVELALEAIPGAADPPAPEGSAPPVG